MTAYAEFETATMSSAWALDVRVLGPLEVEFAGRPVALGARKERAVLALLAVHAGSVVSTARLVDELWPDDAPPHAVSTLRVLVSRLRKSLPAGSIVTRGSGYVLDVPAAALDAVRFDEAVTHGRALLAAGDAVAAAATLAEALALWQGQALDGMHDVPALVAEATRLEESRLLATEEWVEAELAGDGHRGLVGPLCMLVERHPLRERFWAQLMRALYRSGRQAEALRAYQRARETLVEELGVEPGPELQQLEAAVLAQSPDLDAPAVQSSDPDAVRAHPGTEPSGPFRRTALRHRGAPRCLGWHAGESSARPRREQLPLARACRRA